MKKIFILGSNGMLGKYLSAYLKEKEFSITEFSRTNFDAKSVTEKELYNIINNNCDVIINCIGIIKSRLNTVNTLETLLVNSVFPQKLALIAQKQAQN